MSGENLLNDGAYDRQSRRVRTRSFALLLQPRVGQRGQHHVAVPSEIAAALEMIEPELVLQFLILLFDGPPLMRQTDERFQRCRRRERDEVVLRSRSGAEPALAEQPDFRGQPACAPVVRWRDANSDNARVPRSIGAVAPTDGAPVGGEKSGCQTDTDPV